ncbi:MAG TPA: TPM domain-containing protein [Thermoanaerobaculia bacterium]|nr:TPM domain-containing protein [Thermoanaerobaculia bacterium]
MKQFLSKLDHDRIVAAIAEAEGRSSGEIRVHVTRRKPKDLEARARKRFEKLGMTKTAHRNGVLIYIAPNLRRFQILGDVGIHEKCGDGFWKETASTMEHHFQRGQFTEGVLAGIEKVGQLLAHHFPRHPGDRNERPDEVSED